jgi:hypothetical protein
MIEDSTPGGSGPPMGTFTAAASTLRKADGGHVHFRRVVGLCFVLAFVIDGGAFLQMAPRTQIIESIICKQQFPDQIRNSSLALGEDSLCKGESVQSELAYLNGIQQSLDVIPSKFRHSERDDDFSDQNFSRRFTCGAIWTIGKQIWSKTDPRAVCSWHVSSVRMGSGCL